MATRVQDALRSAADTLKRSSKTSEKAEAQATEAVALLEQLRELRTEVIGADDGRGPDTDTDTIAHGNSDTCDSDKNLARTGESARRQIDTRAGDRGDTAD